MNATSVTKLDILLGSVPPLNEVVDIEVEEVAVVGTVVEEVVIQDHLLELPVTIVAEVGILLENVEKLTKHVIHVASQAILAGNVIWMNASQWLVTIVENLAMCSEIVQLVTEMTKDVTLVVILVI